MSLCAGGDPRCLSVQFDPGCLPVQAAALPACMSGSAGGGSSGFRCTPGCRDGAGRRKPGSLAGSAWEDEGPGIVVTGSDGGGFVKLDTSLHSCHCCNMLTQFSVYKTGRVSLLALSVQRLNLTQFLGKKTPNHSEYILV